ncbi:hypothetical protein [Streptomyces sp. NBC_01235]|uniref:hypothetical protein n=1 Tax=Streptomyces sp. NBC_01235 TaxID=2903788 RepID=UPI002E131E3D|nr:hypothetical protein OG289_26560 [Streptomyces sp. NBC_01235]
MHTMNRALRTHREPGSRCSRRPVRRCSAPGLAALEEDLATGRWRRHHSEPLGLDAVDVGYRLLVTDV